MIVDKDGNNELLLVSSTIRQGFTSEGADHDKNQIATIRPLGFALAAIVLVGSMGFAAWAAWIERMGW